MIGMIGSYILVPLEILYNFGFSRGGPRCPPDRGFGALGPSENTPIFLKRRYAAQKFFFPRGLAKKSLARTRKNGFEPGFEPGFSSFWLNFDLFFPCASSIAATAAEA